MKIGKNVMSKIFTITVSIFVIIFASTGLRAAEFSEIMNLMKNADIELQFAHGTRPFKVFKDGDDWILEQQENFERSTLKYEGNNKISFNDFPVNWPINGTWKFSKDGNKCKLNQLEDNAEMTWKCNLGKVTKSSSNKKPLSSSQPDVGDQQKVSSGSDINIDKLEKQLKYLKARKVILDQIKELENKIKLFRKKLEILKLEFETGN